MRPQWPVDKSSWFIICVIRIPEKCVLGGREERETKIINDWKNSTFNKNYESMYLRTLMNLKKYKHTHKKITSKCVISNSWKTEREKKFNISRRKDTWGQRSKDQQEGRLRFRCDASWKTVVRRCSVAERKKQNKANTVNKDRYIQQNLFWNLKWNKGFWQ